MGLTALSWTPNTPSPPPTEFDQSLPALVVEDREFNVITMCFEWFQYEDGMIQARSSPTTDKIDIVIDEPEEVKGHFKRVHAVGPMIHHSCIILTSITRVSAPSMEMIPLSQSKLSIYLVTGGPNAKAGPKPCGSKAHGLRNATSLEMSSINVHNRLASLSIVGHRLLHRSRFSS